MIDKGVFTELSNMSLDVLIYFYFKFFSPQLILLLHLFVKVIFLFLAILLELLLFGDLKIKN